MKINTLHICNLDEVNNIDDYWPVIAQYDQVVLYAHNIKKTHYEKFESQHPEIKKHYQSTMEKCSFTNLTMQKWLQLVKNANKTMTWK